MALPARHHGYLALDLACHDGRTSVARQRARPPLQTFGLQEANRHGGAYLQILNPCGGLFEGDSAELQVSLQRGAHLYLTTQAATKLYPAENGQVSRQHIRFHVASDAVLEYFPLPLIPFTRALYLQQTEIRVESGGVGLIAEVIAPGRVARGEYFSYHMLRSRLEGWVDDRLAVFEQLILQPGQYVYSGLGLLDGKSHLGSLYVLTSRSFTAWLPTWNHRLTEQYEACIGITELAHGGLVVRLLAQTGQEIMRRLNAVHRLIRTEGLGLPPLQVYQPYL
jgi:urease accessory protein